ncbi:MAG: Hsp70 family protein, partial [Myxococcota bacterium]
MSAQTPPTVIPAPKSKVRVRIAGRAEVNEGIVERYSEAGVMLDLKRAPELGIMTLLEFVAPDESVLLRRTACVVFRRSSVDDRVHAALEFVDLGPAEDPEHASLLSRFFSLFTRKRNDPNVLEEELPPEDELPVDGPVLGVDLGTSTSCAAIVEGGKAMVIQHTSGSTIPSVVHFDTSGRRRVGESARERIPLEPTRTVFGSKRFLGRSFTSQEVRRWGHFFPYQMVQGAGGATAVKIGHELYSLEEVAAEILRTLKRRAETVTERPVGRVVLSVPAY